MKTLLSKIILLKILLFCAVMLCTVVGLCACEAPFRADVTSYVLDSPADAVYELGEDLRLQLPPYKMSQFDYLGGTAVTKMGCFPLMKPAGEKGTFAFISKMSPSPNLPKGTRVTLNRLYMERLFLRFMWSKTAVYALYAELTIHTPHHEHVWCPLLLRAENCDGPPALIAKRLLNPRTGAPLQLSFKQVMREAVRVSPEK